MKLDKYRLCVDFVNTLSWRGREVPAEGLISYSELITWSRQVGIITPQDANKLLNKVDRHPADGKKVLLGAVDLRETIYRIFAAIIENQKPAKEDLADFNNYLSKTMVHSQIINTKNGFSWDSSGDKSKMDWVLNPVIRSAADLLVSDELQKLKSCSDPMCRWLFLDISRNQSRRWCDMKDCGNRAKAKRFYQKKQIIKKKQP
ncbi:MAG: CGNR zinc finger domain-containing protein [Desulfobacteraceae bacterium]